MSKLDPSNPGLRFAKHVPEKKKMKYELLVPLYVQCLCAYTFTYLI